MLKGKDPYLTGFKFAPAQFLHETRVSIKLSLVLFCYGINKIIYRCQVNIKIQYVDVNMKLIYYQINYVY